MNDKKDNAMEKVENIARINAASSNGAAENNHTEDKYSEERQRKRLMLREKEKEDREREKAYALKEREENLRRKKRAKDSSSSPNIGTNDGKSAGDNENGRGKRFKAMLAAVLSLAVISLVLAGVLIYKTAVPTENDVALENLYRKSFYDTVSRVDNIDLNLSKLIVTGDSASAQTYLQTAAINSELAENDLQQLPIKDENKFYTTKLVNQVGDYCKYLGKKLAEGEDLTEEDRNNVIYLYEANAEFKAALARMIKNMGEDYSMSSLNDNDIILSDFITLQNLSVEYPELIYDGPFSDGREEIEAKGLYGDEITETAAKSTFTELFKDMEIKDATVDGTTGGAIATYNLSGTVKGDILYAQISKKGGRLIMFSYAGSCNAVNYGEDAATEKAQEFLLKAGVDNMTAVWSNLSDNVYTINFAYLQNGVIIYPDLIKIRVCAETLDVIGFEGISYYSNHTVRTLKSPEISEEEAAKRVSGEIETDSVRLAVIPVGVSSETLCYEFAGTGMGATYYIYIDAVTGRQREMFKVVNSGEGSLLM